MALGYTVNWMEQGRNPSEVSNSSSREVYDTEHRVVVKHHRYWRQSRSRKGTQTFDSKVVYADVTYVAITISIQGGTTTITRQQAEDIQKDAYSQGCVSCTTAYTQGGNFSVTKVVREAVLSGSTASEIEWEEWGEWTPTLP